MAETQKVEVGFTASAVPDMLEVKIVRGYWPLYEPVPGEQHGKLLPGDIVKLPTKEAKGIIRKGIAEFPPEEDDDGDE